jgi:hypothetical protein
MAILKTTEVNIDPQGALNVMQALDEQPHPWGLSPDENGVFHAWQDGNDVLLKIRLHGDGTWEAFTDVVIGIQELP